MEFNYMLAFLPGCDVEGVGVEVRGSKLASDQFEFQIIRVLTRPVIGTM